MKLGKRIFVLFVVLPASLLWVKVSQGGDIRGKIAIQGLKSPENIAVYVEALPGKRFDPPAEHALIDQKKLTFTPHVTVVLQGTTVDFLNSDPIRHNVTWPSIGGDRKKAANLGTWRTGKTKSFQFNDVGVVPLLCFVHANMSGYVIVVPTPYFALTDKDGNFQIKNVPPGHYNLVTWSEDGRPTTQAIDASAGGITVELTVKK